MNAIWLAGLGGALWDDAQQGDDFMMTGDPGVGNESCSTTFLYCVVCLSIIKDFVDFTPAIVESST